MRLSGGRFSPLETTLPEVLDGAPDGIAAVDRDRVVTTAELRALSRAAGASLLDLGVAKGDRVGLLASNGAEFIAAHYGAARTGAIVVPLSTRASEPELGRVLDHAGVSVAIAEPRFRDVPFLATLERLAGGLPDLRAVVSLPEVLDGDADRFEPRCLEPSDPTLLIYTSGTTGEPKGCLHAHRSYVSSAAMTARMKALTPDDRIVGGVPFFNAFGIVNCVLEALLSGAAIVIQRAFDPGETLRLIDRERGSVLLGTPTMWSRIAEHPDFGSTDLSSLRTGTMAGAPAAPALVARWRAVGCDLVLIYGLSEATSILANGRVSPGIEVLVGAGGELCSRGYNQMLGYFHNEEATAARIVDGWIRTGDLAKVGEDGAVEVLGRADDMFIVGGFNVQPVEVENVLREHPGVADAAAFGIPDADLGEVPAAWVIGRPEVPVTAAALTALCQERLASHKVPRAVRFVDEFPLTANGKVQRFRMREVTVSS